MGLPPLRDLRVPDGPRLSIALMDGGGRLQLNKNSTTPYAVDVSAPFAIQ
jgi:hypothetical protein